MYETVTVKTEEAIGAPLDYILCANHGMRLIRMETHLMVVAENKKTPTNKSAIVGYIPFPGFKPDDCIGVPALDHVGNPLLWYPLVEKDSAIVAVSDEEVAVFSKHLEHNVKHKSEAVARLRVHLLIRGVLVFEVPVELIGGQ